MAIVAGMRTPDPVPLTDDGEKVLRRLLVRRRPGHLDLDCAADVSVVLDLLHREEEALLDVSLLLDLGRALEPDVRRPHLAVGELGCPIGARPEKIFVIHSKDGRGSH